MSFLTKIFGSGAVEVADKVAGIADRLVRYITDYLTRWSERK